MNAHQGVGVDIDVCVDGSPARPPRRQSSQGGDLNVGVGGEKTLVPVYSCASGRGGERERERERKKGMLTLTLMHSSIFDINHALHSLTQP